jgi:hypothetical protein
MTKDIIVQSLIEAVAAAKRGEGKYIPVEYDSTDVAGSNQFLFFMKPELTERSQTFAAVADFVFKKLADFNFSIERISVISGEYLAEYGIISDHYGIIDKTARAPVEAMRPNMWEAFESHFNVPGSKARVIGGIDYLKSHADIDEDELSRRWLDRGFIRLGSGTYCQYIDEEDVYLVNGFYPKLLNHFSRKGSCIVTCVLRSDTSWKQARVDFTGTTVPENAVTGSIRRELLMKKDDFCLDDISPSLNGVHLSAGPVEGLLELMRFTADRTLDDQTAGIGDFLFGERLISEFDPISVQAILNNAVVETDSGESTTFDITEELDSEDAIAELKKAKLKI